MLVVDRVMRHLERRAAGEQPDPDLPFSGDERNEGHHLSVGGDRGGLLQTDEVRQAPELHVGMRWTPGAGDFRFRGAGQGLVDFKTGIADVAPPFAKVLRQASPQEPPYRRRRPLGQTGPVRLVLEDG